MSDRHDQITRQKSELREHQDTIACLSIELAERNDTLAAMRVSVRELPQGPLDGFAHRSVSFRRLREDGSVATLIRVLARAHAKTYSVIKHSDCLTEHTSGPES